MSENHEKMLERVRKLLAKAAGTEFEAEAETFRAAADNLMTKYAIEMWQVELAQQGKEGQTKPEVKNVNISWWWEVDRDLAGALWSVLTSVCEHARCRIAYKEATYTTKSVPIVGMPADLMYCDMLFTHLFIQMMDTMDPKPKPGEDLVEALVRMKESGLKWEEIYRRLKAAGYYPADQAWNPSKMDYAGKYTRYCSINERERVRTTPAVYRRSFAIGFSSALSRRLRKQREEQGQSTGTMAIALLDISKVVENAMLEFFPSMGQRTRSSGKALKSSLVKFDDASMARGSTAGHAASIISNSPKVGGTGSPKQLN